METEAQRCLPLRQDHRAAAGIPSCCLAAAFSQPCRASMRTCAGLPEARLSARSCSNLRSLRTNKSLPIKATQSRARGIRQAGAVEDEVAEQREVLEKLSHVGILPVGGGRCAGGPVARGWGAGSRQHTKLLPTENCPFAALSCARGEGRCRNVIHGIAGGLEFGALLGERDGVVIGWAGNGIGGVRK
ncbi:hypothetical protein EI94DRAFT_1737511 [Lactarius quietus]|nr:hypothetical protein EI94DRAFT_1737511 [Lactarius quietus]